MPASTAGLYERASAALDDGRLEEGLALVEQLVTASPNDVDAIVLKAEALVLADRWEEAEELLQEAAHIHKDEPAILLATADLAVDFYPEDHAAQEQALELAQRGEMLARKRDDTDLLTSLQLVQGRALEGIGDLTRAAEAFQRAYESSGRDDEILVELAMALFESLRFEEARDALAQLKQRCPDDARVHHYIGLMEERAGHEKEAQAAFDKAHQLDPEEFPSGVAMTEDEFSDAVEAAFEELPPKIQRYLDNVPIMIDPIPGDDDLAGDPPLSPLSLGMFRGMPGGQVSVMDPWSQMPSSILLFQHNLERYVRTRDELIEAIETTLLHEVGHYMGWDEEDLYERGLD